MISINAVLFGVLVTIFVEMAVIIIVCIIAPRLHGHHKVRPANNIKKYNNTEVKSNG